MKVRQRDRVLAALARKRDWTDPWICGVDFVEGSYDVAHRYDKQPAILRYSAVIGVLRKDGHKIEGRQCPDHKTFRFRMVSNQVALF